MFGGAKSTFGQQPAVQGFSFNNQQTASPFGVQNSFGKPAATSGFGQPSTFGQQNSTLFGGGNQTTGLFGANPAPTFGQNVTTTQSSFGGGFGQQTQNNPVFGQTQQNNNTSLFGASTNSAFGATKPSSFGFGSPQPSTALFGQTNVAQTNTGQTNVFGQNNPNANVFGNTTSNFGANNVVGANGTAIAKYQPIIGTDTLIKNGQTNTVSTKLHCITSMKEYESKSLEELRIEDYMANRKGPQSVGNGIFGATMNSGPFGASGFSTASSTAGFGQQTENKGIFGNPGFGNTQTFGATNQTPAAGSLFGKPFPAPAATAQPGLGGFANANNAQSNIFTQKPFGPQPTTTGLFGQTPATAAPSFGQNTSSFATFGQNNSIQQAPLFGQDKPAFALTSTANTSFGGFGTNANTNTTGGTLFGAKPQTTGFAAAPSFGNTLGTAGGFGGFGQTNTGGSLFNTSFNKSATTFGGFGTQTTTAPIGGGLQLGTTNNSLFGNTANKPGLFGNTLNTSGGIFSTNPSYGQSNALGMGQNSLGLTSNLGTIQNQATVPIHQQIMALTTSPYGDNPIFKDLLPTIQNDELYKPTNPAAQKAILESSTNQFKVSPKVGSGVRIKPVGNVLTKKSLFEGLEEYDSSVEESFSLKPNAKRLVLKPKTPPTTNNNNNHVIQNVNTLAVTNAEDVRSSPTLNFISPIQSVQSNKHNFDNEFGKIDNSNALVQQEIDNSRRVSWLQSTALDKVRQNNRLSEIGLDNTLQELTIPIDKISSPSDCLGNSFHNAQNNDVMTNMPSSPNYLSQTSNDSILSNRSYLNDTNLELLPMENHPTGIILRRPGYYTIPSLNNLLNYLNDDDTCIVQNFTIGREGYGNVFFSDTMDVFGLNLDEIVHFRHKEVIIYPDDNNKPPVGSGLNRKAQVTLDQVWPHDKTFHEPIKDPVRLGVLDYEGKLRRVCDKHDTRFIEYRPETGSWVFKVDHFSKYGLSDTDEEDNIPTDPKKAKLVKQNAQIQQKQQLSQQQQGIQLIDPDILNPFINQSMSHSMLNSSIDYQNNFEQNNEISFLENIENQNNNITSPSIALAMKMGSDAHKVQLMKASFFFDDDESDRKSVSEYGDRDSPDQMVPNKRVLLNLTHLQSNKRVPSITNLSKELSTVNDTPSDKYIMNNENTANTRQTASLLASYSTKVAPLIIKPKVALVKLPGTILPIKMSISNDVNGSCLTDMAFLHGRKFKIGWGLQNTLFTLNTAENSEILKNNAINQQSLVKFFNGRQKNDYSSLILQKIQITSIEAINNFEKSIINHLNVQLNNSIIEKIESSDCPLIKPGGNTKTLTEHYETTKNDDIMSELDEYTLSVWSLCNCLWGECEELEDEEPSSHMTIMTRRELLSKWLEEVVTDKNLFKKTITKNSYLEHLLELIACHKINEACELAFNNDDINLSLLISQISGGPTVRQLMQHQLSTWQENEIDKFIASERLKVFMLISGVSLLSSKSHGEINVFENLDWIKTFALHLWYLCSPISSITDALNLYEKSFQAEDIYAMPPTPNYTQEYNAESTRPIQDLRFHLLKLYSKRSHPLECLLNPATYTSDAMDFRLSWFMLETLETLGYHHCPEISEAQIHISFANQLENNNLWHWSIFVLLHIKERKQREISVQNLLYKYIKLSNESDYVLKEKFIIEKLLIPEKWIYWAKAVFAGSINAYREQAKYLLKAKQWTLAHEVIMNHLAPDAIINDDITLKSLLYEFEDPRLVSNWVNQGQILLDYIELNEKFELLKTSADGDLETRWEGIKPQLAELCSRINLLPCPTSKHRLCQSEIAQRLACLVHGILLTSPYLNSCLFIKMALEKLPLPQEYAQYEVRTLLDTFLTDIIRNHDVRGNTNDGSNTRHDSIAID